MVIKVYISGISASQEIRKTQQRVLFILESLKIDHEVIDITEPGKEEQKSFMREECSKHGKNNTLPPQIFVDDHYLGDYSDFETATENDNLMTFLQLPERKFSKNGDNLSTEISEENENKGGLVNGFNGLTNGSVQIEQEQLNDDESNNDVLEESDAQIDTGNDKVDDDLEKEEDAAEEEVEEEEEEEEED